MLRRLLRHLPGVLLCVVACTLLIAGPAQAIDSTQRGENYDCLSRAESGRYLTAVFPEGVNFFPEDSSGAAFMIDTILRYRSNLAFSKEDMVKVAKEETGGGSWVNMLMLKHMAQAFGFTARGFIVHDPNELLLQTTILAITTDDRRFWQLVTTADDTHVYMLYQSGDVCRLTRADFVRKYAGGRFLFVLRPE